tara:strand:+ start:89 stop:346 length:258 start_codon:yes stop_codon:yes gene_type:complete
VEAVLVVVPHKLVMLVVQPMVLAVVLVVEVLLLVLEMEMEMLVAMVTTSTQVKMLVVAEVVLRQSDKLLQEQLLVAMAVLVHQIQ